MFFKWCFEYMKNMKISLFKVLNSMKVIKLLSDKARFYYHQGYWPNIKNPRTFNEKLIHRKLIAKDDSFATYSDKVKVKNIIGELIGEQYIIKTIATFKTVTLSDLQSIPTPFVVKCNHDSGSVKVITEKAQIDSKLVGFLNERLNYCTSLNTNEYWYADIERLIMVEEYLQPDDNKKVPEDYKFHVFNSGKVFLHIDYGRFDEHSRSIYDETGELIDVEINYVNKKVKFFKPNNYDKMVELAKLIARKIDCEYVRVDFYNVDGFIYFGEVTFAPGAGFSKFTPRAVDMDWGSFWITN